MLSVQIGLWVRAGYARIADRGGRFVPNVQQVEAVVVARPGLGLARWPQLACPFPLAHGLHAHAHQRGGFADADQSFGVFAHSGRYYHIPADFKELLLPLQACLVRLTGTRRAIETCPGRQTAARPGQLRRPQLAWLESSHDLVPAPAFLSAVGQAGTHEKARSDTVPGRGESRGRAGLVVLPTAERLRTVAGDSGLLAGPRGLRCGHRRSHKQRYLAKQPP